MLRISVLSGIYICVYVCMCKFFVRSPVVVMQAQEAYDIGEVPVGCVFVRNGLIIGKGRNKTNESLNVMFTSIIIISFL